MRMILRTFTTSFLILVVFLVSSFPIAYAVEDQFEINLSVTGGADVTAPSIPNGLVATAVSASQINLSWNASTDNVAVTGYNIYRDTVFITNVFGTTYSDTGLSSDTTYTYTVSAVDAASNESAQSAQASATTFGAPTQGGGGQSQTQPLIYDVRVEVSDTRATISWKTNVPTLGGLYWGKTSDLSDGLIQGTVFTTDHQVSLDNLSPGTRYEYRIGAKSGYGVEAFLGNLFFVTNELQSGPTNASNLVAVPLESSIVLKWQNPPENQFDRVRLVRSTSFYPSDPYDGETIYEGTDEVFTDLNVVRGVRYYYSLFTEVSGNYSSGIVADARIILPGEPKDEVDPIEVIPQSENVHPLIDALVFADFNFIQDGKRIQTVGTDSVSIDGSKNLTVSLDYRKVPEVLKSILVTLQHPADPNKTFSFMLRVNEEKTAYEATIAPLGDSGRYGARISIVDYKNQGLKRIAGNLFANVLLGLTDRDCSPMDRVKVMMLNRLLDILLIVICILLFMKALKLVFKKKKSSEIESK